MKNVILKTFWKCKEREVTIWLTVARDPVKAYQEMKQPRGNPASDDFHACHAYNGDEFALYFPLKKLRHSDVAHEIFHCTHRVWERCGDKFQVNHSEPYAFLNGFLHDWVYAQLKKHKIKVV